MSHPLGIDLGTTFSSISKWVSRVNFTGSEPYQIPTEGSPYLPSKVFLEDNSGQIDFVVGGQAQKSGTLYPDQLIKAVKRQMDDASFRYKVLGCELSPIDISAEILKSLLNVVDRIEGPGTYVPEGIIVTVPYYFKHHQHSNTRDAAVKAIKDLYSNRKSDTQPDQLFLGLIAEPIAAGLDYAFYHETKKGKENILVFDLGGGTFDLTVFSLEQSDKKLDFEVLATDGDDRLGGEDFDQSFFQWMCVEEGINLSDYDDKIQKRALKKIHPAITEAKISLTPAQRTEIIIPYAIESMNIEIDPVTREQFEACICGQAGDKRDYYDEIKYKVDSVLDKAGISANDIHYVLLAGGSSQIPKIKAELLAERFGADKLKDAADTRLAVARGAAIYAAYKLDERLEEQGKPREHLKFWEQIIIKERTAHQLGIERSGKFEKILSDNLLTPSSRTVIYEPTTLANDGQRAILTKLKVAQGNPSNFVQVGEIELNDIHTHGRDLEDIDIEITFTASTNLIKVKIFVRNGNEDGSDYLIERDLELQKEN